MNLKAASRLVYVLFMVSMVFVFTTLRASPLTRSIVFSIFIALGGIYAAMRIIIIRKKADADPGKKLSGIQKVSNNIILAAGLGAMLGLTLIVWHVRQIGLPLLNISLVVCITGFIGLMAAPQKPHPFLSPNQIRVYSWILCLCIICTLIGLLLRINHYPGGKPFEYGGIATLAAIMILFIVYAKYKKGRVKL